MAVAVVADAHLGGPGGDPAPLVAQLEALDPARCERLLLLGDLFHVWVGYRRYETPEVARVLPVLERVAGRGIPIDYVEGNRDFFIAGSPYAGVFARVGSESAFVSGGVRYLAVHGDGLDRRDRQYLAWRWLSKSRPVRAAMATLPGVLARRLVHGTERRLATTNREHKARISEPVLSRYAAARLAEGHDVLLLGHFHEARRWSVAGGEVVLLDAWFHTRRVEWLPEGAAEPS